LAGGDDGTKRENGGRAAAPAQPVVIVVHRAPEPVFTRWSPYRTEDRRSSKVWPSGDANSCVEL
jgi:hypothetical protein